MKITIKQKWSTKKKLFLFWFLLQKGNFFFIAIFLHFWRIFLRLSLSFQIKAVQYPTRHTSTNLCPSLPSLPKKYVYLDNIMISSSDGLNLCLRIWIPSYESSNFGNFCVQNQHLLILFFFSLELANRKFAI